MSRRTACTGLISAANSLHRARKELLDVYDGMKDEGCPLAIRVGVVACEVSSNLDELLDIYEE